MAAEKIIAGTKVAMDAFIERSIRTHRLFRSETGRNVGAKVDGELGTGKRKRRARS